MRQGITVNFDDQSDQPNGDDLPRSLILNHGDYLFHFAMTRVQNKDLAEELVQETLFKAIRAISKFRGKASIRTWLSQILRNEIAGHFRKQQQDSRLRKKLESNCDSDLSTLLNPKLNGYQFQSAIERDEFWEMINECFSRLPDHLLETFLAKWNNDDQTPQELSKKLGIKPSNFSVRIFRARLLLRNCIESNWIDTDS